MNLPVYSSNVRAMISLGSLGDDARVGDEVELVWGDANPESPNPSIERHVQTRIRATVIERPFQESTDGSGHRARTLVGA